MNIASFPEQNIIIAKDQRPYSSLPAFITRDTIVISRWRLSFWERIKLLWYGHIWCQQMTFGQQLQPQQLSIEKPEMDNTTVEISK